MHRVSKVSAGLAVVLGLGGSALLNPAAAQIAGLPNDIQVRLGGAGTLGGKMMRELATAWAAKLWSDMTAPTPPMFDDLRPFDEF